MADTIICRQVYVDDKQINHAKEYARHHAFQELQRLYLEMQENRNSAKPFYLAFAVLEFQGEDRFPEYGYYDKQHFYPEKYWQVEIRHSEVEVVEAYQPRMYEDRMLYAPHIPLKVIVLDRFRYKMREWKRKIKRYVRK